MLWNLKKTIEGEWFSTLTPGGGRTRFLRHLNFRQISRRLTRSFVNSACLDRNVSHIMYKNMTNSNPLGFKNEPHLKYGYFQKLSSELLLLRFSHWTTTPKNRGKCESVTISLFIVTSLIETTLLWEKPSWCTLEKEIQVQWTWRRMWKPLNGVHGPLALTTSLLRSVARAFMIIPAKL